MTLENFIYESVSEILNNKYDESKESKADNIENAKALSLKNNGYAPDCFMLRQFVAANVTADAIATKCVNEADIRS